MTANCAAACGGTAGILPPFGGVSANRAAACGGTAGILPPFGDVSANRTAACGGTAGIPYFITEAITDCTGYKAPRLRH